MRPTPILVAILRSIPSMVRLFSSLIWIYLTLGRRVAKARRAFERQLILEGMSREDARRLSQSYEDLKNKILGMLKQGLVATSTGYAFAREI